MRNGILHHKNDTKESDHPHYAISASDCIKITSFERMS